MLPNVGNTVSALPLFSFDTLSDLFPNDVLILVDFEGRIIATSSKGSDLKGKTIAELYCLSPLLQPFLNGMLTPSGGSPSSPLPGDQQSRILSIRIAEPFLGLDPGTHLSVQQIAAISNTVLLIREISPEPLKESLEILDSIPVGVTLADARDPKLPLVYANHAFLQITGYELHEVIGRNCRFLQGEARNQPGVESIRHAINQKQASTTVVKNFTKDGDVFWNEFTITPLTDASGKVAYFLGIQHDITDLMAARERFQRKELELSNLISAAPISILLCNLDGTVANSNRAAAALFGLEGESLQGRRLNSLARVTGNRSTSAVAQGLWEFLRDSERSDIVPSKLLTRNGKRISVEWRIGQLAGEGLQDRVILTGVDVSLRERIDQLEEERQRLSHSLESFEQALSIVSHELRTPLASIRVQSDLGLMEIQEAKHNSEARFREISAQTLHLIHFVNDLLDVGRLRSGKFHWHWGEVFPSKVLSEVKSSLLPLFLSDTVKLTVECNQDYPPFAGDPGAIRRLLINLIANARRATEHGSVAVVVRRRAPSASTSAGEIEFDIVDTGVGMNSDVLQQLESPYTLRGQVLDEQVMKGCGLGLQICRAIVTAHSGRLTIQSSPGVGTTVRVTLPDVAPKTGGDVSLEPLQH